MQTPITTAQRDQLAAHIAALDNQIQQLTYYYKSSIETASIMFAGISPADKNFKSILAWSKALPVPVVRLKSFLEQYSNDLLLQRNNLVAILEAGTIDFEGQTVQLQCYHCSRLTIHRNYYFIPAANEGWGILAVATPADIFICNECESIKSCRK